MRCQFVLIAANSGERFILCRRPIIRFCVRMSAAVKKKSKQLSVYRKWTWLMSQRKRADLPDTQTINTAFLVPDLTRRQLTESVQSQLWHVSLLHVSRFSESL
ncbi:hypothetical protein BaRGS_00004593 [Batillaria attramentaria]|uniref:Uncharacterized protein n=1 Tax=Batillaria attramentaria TaxID=370345 RepID=A0ABD0LXB8_9CAEN